MSTAPGLTSDSNGQRYADTAQSIEWYAEGQARVVEVGGVRITVRFVGRKGRRARIAITAPAGATFSGYASDTGEPDS